MNSKERVLRAFRRKEGNPDRVPFSLICAGNTLNISEKSLGINLIMHFPIMRTLPTGFRPMR